MAGINEQSPLMDDYLTRYSNFNSVVSAQLCESAEDKINLFWNDVPASIGDQSILIFSDVKNLIAVKSNHTM